MLKKEQGQKKVLVACRADTCTEVTQALTSRGYAALSVPIVTTQPYLPAPVPKGVGGVVLTSAVAVQNLETTLPCYCVGPSTAACAQKKGLNVAYVGTGNSLDLGLWLSKNIPAQTLYHPTTQQPEKVWYDLLQGMGFSVLQEEVYQTALLDTLPPEVVWCLEQNKVGYIMAFSRRGGEHLLKLLGRGIKAENIKKIRIFALSTAVAEPFLEKGFKKSQVYVAPAPVKEILYNVLEEQTKE